MSDGVLLDTVTEPDVVRRARELVGAKHIAVYTPIEPSVAGSAVRAWIAELVDAGADTVILHGTDDHPDPLRLIEALGTS